MNGLAEHLAQRMRMFSASERQSLDEIEAGQRRAVGVLARHCESHSPQFRRRLAAAGLAASDLTQPGGLARLPVLSRRELQSARDIFCDAVPKTHLPLYETRTSGSTGEPVVVRRTSFNQSDWLAATMRGHVWYNRDFLQRFCSIRANIAREVELENWGPPAALLHKTGPMLGMPITRSIEDQAARIAEFGAGILLVYPSDLAGIVDHCEAVDLKFPALREIITIGETLSPGVRARAQALFGARICDMYSSQEAGIIALQCPQSGLYHVMAENTIVEILDDGGHGAREGMAGRVVITDLHNFATPLIRYDIGDYAEAGPQCPCGRGLPTLKRILGRERNLIRMPDGSRHFPLVGFREFRDIAPLVQYQVIQHDLERIEFRMVTERPLTQAEEDRLRAHLQSALGHPFAIQFVYFENRIPAGPNGKFEEFICRIP